MKPTSLLQVSLIVWNLVFSVAIGQDQQVPLEPLEVSPGFEQLSPPVPAWKGGAMERLGDGSILLAYATAEPSAPLGAAKLEGLISRDGGRTWSSQRTLAEDPQANLIRPTLLRTRQGALWLVYYRYLGRQPDGKLRSDLHITSSADDGVTWQPPRLLYSGYTAGQRSAIETRSGKLVIAFSYAVDQGRNVSASLVSADGGQTWKQSNSLEAGGMGGHSGALEPAVVELNDGRLWLLIRTQHGQFWQSFSKDEGLSWQSPTASPIASPKAMGGAPAALKRLADGRLARVSNLPIDLDEGQAAQRTGPVSDWYKHGRGSLAVSLSADDGQTWTKPVVCARGAVVTYPHLLETGSGELLISTGLLRATDPQSGKRLKTDVILLRLADRKLLGM